MAMYYKKKIVYHLLLRIITGTLGGLSGIIEVKETLTDKNGDFGIPSYTAMINPLTREGDTDFIIFKPGYGSFPNYQTSPPGFPGDGMEKFFSQHFGIKGELENYIPYEGRKMVGVIFGIVKLPKVKTWEERRKVGMLSIDFPKKKWPLLHEMLRKDDDFLYQNNKNGGSKSE